jgi:hypothetical protein
MPPSPTGTRGGDAAPAASAARPRNGSELSARRGHKRQLHPTVSSTPPVRSLPPPQGGHLRRAAKPACRSIYTYARTRQMTGWHRAGAGSLCQGGAGARPRSRAPGPRRGRTTPQRWHRLEQAQHGHPHGKAVAAAQRETTCRATGDAPPTWPNRPPRDAATEGRGAWRGETTGAHGLFGGSQLYPTPLRRTRPRGASSGRNMRLWNRRAAVPPPPALDQGADRADDEAATHRRPGGPQRGAEELARARALAVAAGAGHPNPLRHRGGRQAAGRLHNVLRTTGTPRNGRACQIRVDVALEALTAPS